MLGSTLRPSFAVRATVLAGAVLALALLGASPALADSGGTNRQFKGTVSGPRVFDLSTGSFVADLTGNESHLGRVTQDLTGTVIVTGLNSFTVRGTGIVTAANGSKLFTAFSGSGTIDATGGTAGQSAVTVTGGTGRFAGASGEQTDTFSAPPGSLNGTTLTGPITDSFTGTISY